MDIRDNLASIVKERALIQAEVARRAELTPMKLGAVLLKKKEARRKRTSADLPGAFHVS